MADLKFHLTNNTNNNTKKKEREKFHQTRPKHTVLWDFSFFFLCTDPPPHWISTQTPFPLHWTVFRTWRHCSRDLNLYNGIKSLLRDKFEVKWIPECSIKGMRAKGGGVRCILCADWNSANKFDMILKKMLPTLINFVFIFIHFVLP